MAKTLPKGHLSCLSDRFRYTPAHRTDIAQTLARIRRELAEKAQPRQALVVVRASPALPLAAR